MNGYCVARNWARESLSERHVQAIWYDRVLRPDGLVTRTGEAIQVIYPGTWNLGPGPDFKGAVLEVGPTRRRLCGDVEVHLSPQDWEAHGHGRDEKYRHVIAHVTWGCGPDPSSLPREAVTIWIGRFLVARPDFAPETIDLAAYPFARLPIQNRPCYDYLRENLEWAKEILSQAGKHRLTIKAARLRRLMSLMPSHTPQMLDQLFYSEVMNALGYRANSTGFRTLAQAVPLSIVQTEQDNAAAAFLAAAGFVSWPRVAGRPANQRVQRLQAAARLFTETKILSLREASDFSPTGCREILRVMTSDKLMGRGRAAAILANVVLPWALARDSALEVPSWLPPEDLSQVVRLTAWRLLGRDHNPCAYYAHNDVAVQGLIQIHREFCLTTHPNCAQCGLVASLSAG